jgi:hypothetical protein
VRTARRCLPVLFCAAALPAAAQGKDAYLFSAHAARAPVSINGILTEWDAPESVVFAAPPHPTDPNRENSVVVKAQWDWDKLYIAFRVYDTHLVARQVDDRSELWVDDGVELYVSVAPHRAPAEYLGPTEYQFWVNVNGASSSTRGFETARLDFDWQNKDTAWHCDFFSAVRLQGTLNRNEDTDTGYTVELGLPWAAMGYRPRSQDTLLVNFSIEDRDSAEWRRWFDWCELTESFAQPAGWGQMVLEGVPPGPVPAPEPLLNRRALFALIAVALALVLGFLPATMRLTRRRQTDKPVLSLYPKSPQQRTLVERALDIIRTEFDSGMKTADVAARAGSSGNTSPRPGSTGPPSF